MKGLVFLTVLLVIGCVAAYSDSKGKYFQTLQLVSFYVNNLLKFELVAEGSITL